MSPTGERYCDTTDCPDTGTRRTALSQSVPAATTNDCAAVVRNATLAAPEDPLAAATAPTRDAPEYPTTVIPPDQAPNDRVAATEQPVNDTAAGADHTSTGPLCTLRDTLRRQLSPQPATPEKTAPGPAESLDRYATSNCAPDVRTNPDRSTPDGTG